jgi:predicted permease
VDRFETALMMFLIADVRQACRSIARMPALAAVIVLSLALGIGVNTVVFSWVQARVLRPLPGVHDGASVLLVEPNPEGGHYPGTSWLEYRDLRDNLHSFEELFAARTIPLYVGDTGAVERLFGSLVSDNYFSALGVKPALGRFFRADEMQSAGAPAVIVISHRLWQTRFGGSPAVLTRTIRVNARELTIIGVAPEPFQGATPGLQFDGYLPATLAPAIANGSRELEERSIRGYNVMGRLRHGATREQANAEFDALMQRLEGSYPATNTGVRGEVLPFYMSPRGPQRMLNAALAIFQAVMLLVLLAVCGNIANLMLARASARQQEIGIRLSLGANRLRVVSLLLTESVLLAVAGALLGAAMAVWGTSALIVLPITGMPLRFQTSVDTIGMAFALALGLGSGVLFGLAPALQLARMDPHDVLRHGLRTGGRSRLRRTLMAAQVALAVLVLLVAGMFFRSFLETRETDPGFRREGVLLATYDRSNREATAGDSSALNRSLAVRLLGAARAVPGVEGAAIASSVPLDIHGLPSRVFTVAGHARTDGGFDDALSNTVTPGYFDVMKIALVAGTDFAPLIDTTAPRQVIVNEEFVRRFVGNGEPLGRQLRARGGVYVITGVAADSLYNAFGEPPTPAIYFSYRDLPQPRGELHVRVKSGGAASVGSAVLRAARETDPELPVFNVRTLDEHVDTNLILRKVPAQMFSVLGPLLLVLAAMGIYAVVNYTVALRTREIGLRIALGATRPRVVWTFVAEHLRVALGGAALGWLVAYMLAIHLAPGRRVDTVVFASAPVVLLLVATFACWIPAQRGARVDPAVALRNE